LSDATNQAANDKRSAFAFREISKQCPWSVAVNLLLRRIFCEGNFKVSSEACEYFFGSTVTDSSKFGGLR
jgi:hypothetical protein